MRYAALLLMAFLLCACAPVISKGVLKDVDRKITVDMVRKDPLAYAGKKILWGGVIQASENLEASTEVEVLETGLKWGLTPQSEERGESKGRFLIVVDAYLDTAIFKKGRMLTIAGIVKGVAVKKIGKMDYAYPVVSPVEMKLIEPPAPAPAFFYLQQPY